MRKLSMIGLVLWFGLAGCGDSDGDSGAGTGGTSAGTSGGGSGGATAGTGGGVAGTSGGGSGGSSGNAACSPTAAMMTSAGSSSNPACDACVTNTCDIAACYGPGWESGNITGPCKDFLDCICDCPENDVACPAGCLTGASTECFNCQTTVGLCIGTTCAADCM